MIRFILEFETPEDVELSKEQLDGILSDLEDSVMKLPGEFDLYDSAWEEEEL